MQKVAAFDAGMGLAYGARDALLKKCVHFAQHRIPVAVDGDKRFGPSDLPKPMRSGATVR